MDLCPITAAILDFCCQWNATFHGGNRCGDYVSLGIHHWISVASDAFIIDLRTWLNAVNQRDDQHNGQVFLKSPWWISITSRACTTHFSSYSDAMSHGECRRWSHLSRRLTRLISAVLHAHILYFGNEWYTISRGDDVFRTSVSQESPWFQYAVFLAHST